MFKRKRVVILIISICFLSLLPGLSLGKHLLGKVIIYNEGKTILGESKYYRIIKIKKTSIDNNIEMEKWEKGDNLASLFIYHDLEDCPCVYETFELNYLALQDTASKNIPDKISYAYVDFTNLKTGFITTEQTFLGNHVKGEYGSITIKVLGLHEGFNKQESELLSEICRRKNKGVLDKEMLKKFIAFVKTKLICKPQQEIKTIWLSD